ncbi:MAG TPA: hypothetical protein VFX26_03935 [Nitrososphaeraceae archaeon]|nr:hypothetical protein [Nitrososphaeraceae archaeon]
MFPMIVKAIKVIMVHGYRYGHLSNTEQIKGKQETEGPLSSLDSAGSVYINHNYNYKKPAKLIHDSIF